MPIANPKKIIHNNVVIKPDNDLITRLNLVLGTVQIYNGSQLAYDLNQKVFRHGVLMLDLETGGDNDSLLPEYKCNWFPGCKTYGVLLEQDAPIFNTSDEYDPNRVRLETVFKADFEQANSGGIVQILDALDNINTNPVWKQKMNIYYKVKSPTGTVGYMHSLLINKIVYKDC